MAYTFPVINNILSLQKVLLSVTNTFEGRLFVNENFTENHTINDFLAQLLPNFNEQHIRKTVELYADIGLDTVFEQATTILDEGRNTIYQVLLHLSRYVLTL